MYLFYSIDVQFVMNLLLFYCDYAMLLCLFCLAEHLNMKMDTEVAQGLGLGQDRQEEAVLFRTEDYIYQICHLI